MRFIWLIEPNLHQIDALGFDAGPQTSYLDDHVFAASGTTNNVRQAVHDFEKTIINHAPIIPRSYPCLLHTKMQGGSEKCLTFSKWTQPIMEAQ